MTFAAIAAVYEGVKSQLDANDSLTISLADFAINYVPIYLAKRENGLKTIQTDVQNYLQSSLDFTDENAPAEAAMWNEQKSIDTSVMDTGTSSINAMIENAKGEASANQTNVQTTISMQQPINQYLKALLNLIATGLM